MCGGEVFHAKTNHVFCGRRRVQEVAGKDLATGFAEVLRQEGVQDGVNAGVSIGQAVGHEAEDIGRLGQGESAELRPHDDDVVGHPADSEDGDDQEDRLSRLQGEITSV